MLLPFRSKNPPESFPIGTCCLIGLNIVIFMLTSELFFVAKDSVIENWGVKSSSISPITMMTSMFLHADIFHLLGNMWFLYLLGFAVEGRLRTPKFLTLYFVSGIVGDLAHHFTFGLANPDIPSVGASGAIMGVMGAALYMFPFAQVEVFYWFGIIWMGTFSVPIWGVALWYLGTDILLAMLSAMDGVGHLAHIGGAVGGLAMAAIFRSKRDSADASDAKAMYSDVGELHILSPRELSHMYQSDPDNPYLVLNWMYRSLSAGQVDPEALSAFNRLLPRMIQQENISSVAYCVGTLVGRQSVPMPSLLLQIAAKLEKVHEIAQAVYFYQVVLHDHRSTPNQIESTLFRAGFLHETFLGKKQEATLYYNELIRRCPASPLADQARARMAAFV